jgi:two-component system CheB/CheR fusion protein
MTAGNHRIRGTLWMLRTMVAGMPTTRGAPDEAALHLAGRIGAIGRAALWPSCGVDLEMLVRDELLTHAVRTASVAVRGPDVRLRGKAAQYFSVAVHELSTNAIKFGAFSQPGARLEISWHWEDAPDARRLYFDWEELGVTMDSATGRRAGFGSDLVKRVLAHELHGRGEMVFSPDGVHYTLQIPAGEALER